MQWLAIQPGPPACNLCPQPTELSSDPIFILNEDVRAFAVPHNDLYIVFSSSFINLFSKGEVKEVALEVIHVKEIVKCKPRCRR